MEAERAAYEALERIADEIFDEADILRNMGGDIPFDGVLDYLSERLHERIGFAPSGRPEGRRRKVFGVRASLVVFKRDGYRCVACGSDEDLTVDHIFPWSKGGSDELDNLQTLCGTCNSSKGAR